MRAATLVYCLRNDLVLLGMKKRGFGTGKLNGYGGKVHEGETIEQAAIRELKEETNVDAKTEDLKKMAEIDFYFPDAPKEKNWDQTVHVYVLTNWHGEPQETEEMKPEWHNSKMLPKDKMWVADPHWLPKVLNGEKLKASITFGKLGETIINKEITTVKSL